ncbi:MAG: hypothetical protein FJ110_15230 [Deltaproteobacteria bacterium]|nr:hypothetical protein [Deltaproteobacteria bacterium]
MKDQNIIRERYLQDNVPTRLGGLAANLSRINSFSGHDANQETVGRLLDESKLFIEWTAAETEIDTAAELVELQIQLAQWRLDWSRIWVNTSQRRQVAEKAIQWSRRVLELSGLLG